MKISYRKHWSEDGTVYSQRIRMTKEEFASLSQAVDAEIALGYPRKARYAYTSGNELFYLRPLMPDIDNLCHLTLTQTRFINLFCKLPLLDRNTYLYIS